MPPSLRRQGGRTQQHRMPPPSPPQGHDPSSDVELDDRQEEQEEQDLDANDDDETLSDDLAGLEGDEEDDEEEEGDEELASEDGLASPNHTSDPLPNLEPPPPYLREISTLASWTVSSSKPGCSIPQLRHPNTNLFWQSDGPQPHYLNIHFFKLVRIVGLRLYLDFEQDESYTPTKIIFLAGSGLNDLQEWGEMRLESPRGWIWADFSGVGDPESDDEGDDEEGGGGGGGGGDGNPTQQPHHLLTSPPPQNNTTTTPNDASSDSENAAPTQQPPEIADLNLDFDIETPGQQGGGRQPFPPIIPAYPPTRHRTHNQNQNHTTPQQQHQQLHHPSTPLSRPHPRTPFTPLSPHPHPLPPSTSTTSPPKLPVLRAHLLQIKILENHQNGKDTHLRGLQVFARNDDDGARGSHGGGGAGGRARIANAHGDGVKGVTGRVQGRELMEKERRERRERRRREEVWELGKGIGGMGRGEGRIR